MKTFPLLATTILAVSGCSNEGQHCPIQIHAVRTTVDVGVAFSAVEKLCQEANDCEYLEWRTGIEDGPLAFRSAYVNGIEMSVVVGRCRPGDIYSCFSEVFIPEAGTAVVFSGGGGTFSADKCADQMLDKDDFKVIGRIVDNMDSSATAAFDVLQPPAAHGLPQAPPFIILSGLPGKMRTDAAFEGLTWIHGVGWEGGVPDGNISAVQDGKDIDAE